MLTGHRLIPLGTGCAQAETWRKSLTGKLPAKGMIYTDKIDLSKSMHK